MRTCGVGRSNKPSGFTLLELVVVMLVLTVVFGLVLPQVSSGLLRNDLKSSSRRLAGAIAEARSQAMVEGRFWELTIDLDANTFWTGPSKEESSDLGTFKKRSLVGDVRFMDIQKMPEETTSAGRVALLFHPKGLAEPAVIHLVSADHQVQTLVVKMFNSRLAVQDGYL